MINLPDPDDTYRISESYLYIYSNDVGKSASAELIMSLYSNKLKIIFFANTTEV